MGDWFIEFLKFLIMDGTLLVGLFLLITWAVVLLQQRLPFQQTQSRLVGSSGWGASFAASVGGVITPFCSCSTIPVLNGMLRAGVGFAPSFAFLVSSPVVNEGVLILLFSTGRFVAGVTFLVVGLILTTTAGVVAQKLGLDRHIVNKPSTLAAGTFVGSATPSWPGWKAAGKFAWLSAIQELRGVGTYLVVGLLVGGVIYGAVPKEMLGSAVGTVPDWALYLICSLIGLPLYVSPIAAIPIGFALIEKGFPVGPLVTFLVAAIGTSPPEIVLLMRMFRLPLVLAHTVTVVLCALLLGIAVALAL